MPDCGAVLGAIGRGALAVGRVVWEAMNTPTEADEDDARSEISRLATFIDDEVPEDLRGRAWGLVVDELRRIDADIEAMVEQAKAEEAEGEGDDAEWKK
ncbi:hypothetical protein ACFYZ4_37260 [Streptomyces sp. NPDC001513]|uniref:hypothetical protein n=1 Tax=Streptomyces sp. NPDC001513 TaxID=3364580 RepID=UPI0036816E80